MPTEAETVPWMADADSSIAAGIDNLRPTRPVDETPTGRLTGIEQDTWHTYREIHALLTGQVLMASREAYEQRLADCLAALIDLGKRTDNAYQQTFLGRCGNNNAEGSR